MVEKCPPILLDGVVLIVLYGLLIEINALGEKSPQEHGIEITIPTLCPSLKENSVGIKP